jgi:transposase
VEILALRCGQKRLDHHHKIALKLVREHDAIACERLNIAGTTRAPAPRPAVEQAGVFLPNGAAGKARFECVACGFTANADHVGALNVLHRAGLARCPAA